MAGKTNDSLCRRSACLQFVIYREGNSKTAKSMQRRGPGDPLFTLQNAHKIGRRIPYKAPLQNTALGPLQPSTLLQRNRVKISGHGRGRGRFLSSREHVFYRPCLHCRQCHANALFFTSWSPSSAPCFERFWTEFLPGSRVR